MRSKSRYSGRFAAISSLNNSGPNSWQPQLRVGSVAKSWAEAAVPTPLSSIVPPKSERPAASAIAATFRVFVRPPCLLTLSEKASAAPMRGESERVFNRLDGFVGHDG